MGYAAILSLAAGEAKRRSTDSLAPFLGRTYRASKVKWSRKLFARNRGRAWMSSQ